MTHPTPSLACLTPPAPIGDSAFVEEFSALAKRWKRKIRNGNLPWQGEFVIDTKSDGASKNYMEDWFNTRLMYRVQERIGSYINTEWLVWEIELTTDGFKQVRSMENVWNAIKVIYVDEAGRQQETQYFTDQPSIDRYLRRELVVTLDDVDLPEANTRAQTMLAEMSEPYPVQVRIDPRLPDRLKVTLVGDVFTANNRYVTAATPNTTANAGTHISDIITADCDLLTATAIEQNPAPDIFTGYLAPIRAWDKIQEIIGMGDGTKPWEFDITAGGDCAYHEISNEVRWQWHGSSVGLVSTGGSINPWQMKPGVLDNRRVQSQPTQAGAFLTSRSHTQISEIEMSTGSEFPALKPSGFDQYELERQSQFQREWIELYEKGEVYL